MHTTQLTNALLSGLVVAASPFLVWALRGAACQPDAGECHFPSGRSTLHSDGLTKTEAALETANGVEDCLGRFGSGRALSFRADDPASKAETAPSIQRLKKTL